MVDETSTIALHAEIEALVKGFYDTERPAGMIVGAYPPGRPRAGAPWIFPVGEARAGEGQAPDKRTVWQIGSVTKTFTATLLAQAIHDGLSPATPVQSWAPQGVVLPTYATWNQSVPLSFVNLATHTAGLPLDPRGVSPGGYSIQEMYRYLESYALAVAPGTSWNYSNVGFGLLGDILVRYFFAAGYEELIHALKRRGQLSMPDTVITPDADQLERRAWGYTAPGSRASWATPTWPAFNSSGALYSTIHDVMIWLAYNLGWLASPLDDLLPTLQTVWYDKPPQPMGLGWEVCTYEPGASCWGKGGNTTGFTSYVAFSRELGVGVAALCNSVWVWPQNLVEEILRLFARQPPGAAVRS